MLPKFVVLKPANIAEAMQLKEECGDKAVYYAGGTDILVLMQEGKLAADFLVNIRGLKELQGIEVQADGSVRIGAGCTFTEIIKNTYIRENYPQLVDGMGRIGSTQIRNMATVGGNVCNAIPSADSVPCLLVTDAQVEIYGKDGTRCIPLSEFYRGFRQTALQQSELVAAFLLPPPQKGYGAAYYKYTRRKAMDIALFGVAVSLQMEGTLCIDARVAMATAAPTPIRVREAETYLAGKELTEDVIVQAGVVAADAIHPRSSVRSSGEYRKRLAKVLTPRAIRIALDRIHE